MIKRFLIWLFQDFAYKLYSIAENKFTLHFDTLDATPFGAPYNLAGGQVGVYYPTVDNGAGIFTMGGSPNPFNCSHHPFGYLIQAGVTPNGLNFTYPNPLAYPVNCPLNYPPILGLGINEFDLTGFPTVAGTFDFTIRFITQRYREEPPAPGQNYVDRLYRIRIRESTFDLLETDEQPFTCNFPPPSKKKTSLIGGYPIICCDPKRHLLTGKIIPCPERIRTQEGVYYYKISCDPKTGRCCYARNDYRIINK